MSIFWRERWTGYQPFVVWLFNQRFQEKLRRAFYDRIDLRKELFIGIEFIMIPEVSAQPRSARRPEPPLRAVDWRGRAPDVCIMVTDPATSAILHPRRAPSVLDQFSNHTDQRLVTFRQVGCLGGRIIHLCIDVDCVLRLPGR